jgi:hypothetical protein
MHDKEPFVDDEGYLCHPDGTRMSMEMTLGTRLLLWAVYGLRRVVRRLRGT